jgi:hypothetical protein
MGSMRKLTHNANTQSTLLRCASLSSEVFTSADLVVAAHQIEPTRPFNKRGFAASAARKLVLREDYAAIKEVADYGSDQTQHAANRRGRDWQ